MTLGCSHLSVCASSALGLGPMAPPRQAKSEQEEAASAASGGGAEGRECVGAGMRAPAVKRAVRAPTAKACRPPPLPPQFASVPGGSRGRKMNLSSMRTVRAPRSLLPAGGVTMLTIALDAQGVAARPSLAPLSAR